VTPPPARAPEYIGGRLSIAEALRHAAGALRELGDEDLASTVELAATETARRGRDDEVTRELPIPLPEKP
jgi:hypothetical protein